MKFLLRYPLYIAIGVAPGLVGYTVVDSWQAWAFIISMNVLVVLNKAADE